MYVIKNKDTGLFVNKRGQKSSYTNSLLQARKFNTVEEAEGNCCIKNEKIFNLEPLLDEYRR